MPCYGTFVRAIDADPSLSCYILSLLMLTSSQYHAQTNDIWQTLLLNLWSHRLEFSAPFVFELCLCLKLLTPASKHTSFKNIFLTKAHSSVPFSFLCLCSSIHFVPALPRLCLFVVLLFVDSFASFHAQRIALAPVHGNAF